MGEGSVRIVTSGDIGYDGDVAATARTNQLHVRASDEEEVRWAELAHRFGYDNTSEFVRAVLSALSDRYESEEWKTGLLHLEGDKITGPTPSSPTLVGTYAFPVAAPARFWRYVDAARKGKIHVPEDGK